MGKRALAAVPNTSNEYPGSEIISRPNGSVLSGSNEISSTLGLYFQWPQYRSCVLELAGDRISCEMDFDRDEAIPQEIRLKTVSGIAISTKTKEAIIRINFQIFGIAYEFTSRILAYAEEADLAHWNAIVELPNKVVVRRSALPPRSVIPESSASLKSINWVLSESKGVKVEAEVLEIGLGSLKIRAAQYTDFSGTLNFGPLPLMTNLEAQNDGTAIAEISFRSASEYGLYFDLVRSVVFPTLKDRYDFDLSAGIKLYEETNYFAKYGEEKSEQTRNELVQTWEAIRSGRHSTNLDHYITDHSGNPTGCSGLALQTFSNQTEVWSFHQLCALKNPSLVDQSGLLYTWRAHYLAVKPGELLSSSCFLSKSRWLERIYVKHAMNSELTTLLPTKNKKCTVIAKQSSAGVEFRKFNVGSLNRISSVSEKIWASANPRFLNANENLDTIVAPLAETTVEELVAVAGSLVHEMGRAEHSFLFTVNSSADSDGLVGSAQLSDRFIIIPKSELMSFASSVVHSVAVTERKLLNGAVY